MAAADFITKPKHSNTMLFAGNHLKKRLVPLINAAVSSTDGLNADVNSSNLSQRLFKRVSLKETEPLRADPLDVVVMGGCTGGPKALLNLIPGLPGDFSVPIVIAQHCPVFYSAELARQLDKQSALAVQEAYDGAKLKPGIVWVAPGGCHTEIQYRGSRPVLNVHKGPREKSHRPSINKLFRSASKVFGPRVLALMLSGSGEDGLEGISTVKAAGGQVMIQHPDAALAPHIPHTIIQAGYADSGYRSEEPAHQIVSDQTG